MKKIVILFTIDSNGVPDEGLVAFYKKHFERVAEGRVSVFVEDENH